MENVDYIVLASYFLVLIGIGVWAYFRVRSSADFYTAGGNLPWWLSGISHHVSGYSGVVFVAYAAIAYTHGLTIYIWWAVGIAIAMIGTTFFIAPRWARLRSKTGIQSPTEYLLTRYNLPTQQVMAWSGVIVKLFDIGAKWAAIGILLNVFTGLSIGSGIAISGVVTLIYITIGGLWADVVNDLFSFIIQFVSGIIMFVVILQHLGDGMGGVVSMWDQLPAANSQPYNDPYTFGFSIGFMVIAFFSYSGGTWNLATRFISSSSGQVARKASMLSMILYLIWPFILFFPMFAAPIFFPDLEDPTQSYSLMAIEFLPAGITGLLLASLFSNTLSMVSSDANTISAVITRDIMPVFMKKIKGFSQSRMLAVARVTTFVFILITIIIAWNSSSFGGVIGLIITWFSALLGPISVPMILGLLPRFKHSDSTAALLSIFGGLTTFALFKLAFAVSYGWELSGPIITSLVIYVGYAYIVKKPVSEEVEELISSLNLDK
ncbi:Na+:solute symporter [Membranicola marinus]|uniref:Na+:solute symporter n=1 Tax=Membranihabitans marinus TaxID=1227546 RepID=A0A953HS88_9BACT|nr:sodium:solute symporter family protein [Membranihabitans marinus]MBY5957430.1 Na+:solute symporter [Membranihabitans marinus]